jgi:hypothetical protein
MAVLHRLRDGNPYVDDKGELASFAVPVIRIQGTWVTGVGASDVE